MVEELVRTTSAASYHNLKQLAEEIRHEYFRDCAPVKISWGKKIERKKRRSIRLGSYHRGEKMIRVHPLLNSADIPYFFVQSIIFHEFLHHVLGPSHDRRFHLHEKQFRFYREAKEWLRTNLPVLLGRRGRVRSINVPPRRPPTFAPKPVPVVMTQMSLF